MKRQGYRKAGWGTLIRHEEYKEMAAVQALGALDPAEAREFEIHLSECAECRAELESWREVTAEFAYVAPTVEPSPSLRSRILESVRAEGKPQSSGLETRAAGVKAAEAQAETSRAESSVIPFKKPARRLTSSAPRIFAIAASVAFVALIISLILLWNRYNATRHEIARLSDRLNQSQEELTLERRTLADERAAKDLFAAPDAFIGNLSGTEMAENARARFIFDRKTGRAMLMADGLPPAPEGKAYQLWFISEGKPPMPGHVFKPDAKGHTEMRDEVPAEARNANTFAVTLEPQSGVTAPTGPKYLLSAS
jgi:anti-sigma-K factor RskA